MTKIVINKKISGFNLTSQNGIFEFEEGSEIVNEVSRSWK